eukprot:scaffold10103_cov59-Phaeocystis_antarctica.AAC.4
MASAPSAKTTAALSPSAALSSCTARRAAGALTPTPAQRLPRHTPGARYVHPTRTPRAYVT